METKKVSLRSLRDQKKISAPEKSDSDLAVENKPTEDNVDSMGDFNFLDNQGVTTVDGTQEDIYLSSKEKKRQSLSSRIQELSQESAGSVESGVFVRTKPDEDRAKPGAQQSGGVDFSVAGKDYSIVSHSRISKDVWKLAIERSPGCAIFEYFGIDQSVLLEVPKDSLPGATYQILHGSVMVKNGHSDDWDLFGYQHCLTEISGSRALLLKQDSPEMDLFGGSIIKLNFNKKSVSKKVTFDDDIPD